MKDNVKKITIRDMAFQLLKEYEGVLWLDRDDLYEHIRRCIYVATYFQEMFELGNEEEDGE